MPVERWSREQLLIAMNLYFRIPFGQFDRKNHEVIRVANAIRRSPSSVAMKLSNLASLDPYHKDRGIKGLSGASEADRKMWNEFHADWERMSAESERLRHEFGIEDSDREDQAVSPPVFEGPTETQRMAKVRLAQRFFRKAVFASYQSSCCVSGINLPELLVASHILPWSQYPKHRVDPKNGLCLSKIHDAAFDKGLITFDEDFRLILSSELSSATSNEVLATCFTRYAGKSMTLPERFQPHAEFLATHRSALFRG